MRVCNGGQVAAQTIAAAARTVTARRLHSLRGVPAAGRPDGPAALFGRDAARGRTFSTRRVTVSQHGRPIIMEALVSFMEMIDGPGADDYQQVMSSAPEPEELTSLPDQLRAHLGRGILDYLGRYGSASSSCATSIPATHRHRHSAARRRTGCVVPLDGSV